ncbi:glucosaminidase domain-containing protein [Bacillus sp. 3255]|uniref:glucosaminidase domain-containing protein n=1 Tax=Bacillus sp. 3255 TaxID=2817904 RepID=UPI00286799B5|nr:glucosaminidase domain-containing protein [Bacillus sp. 3255]MDR6882218.1 flagellum-specific peptidoglycan hydrolase FlgJ [Bacillus sp. 3255]
MRSPLRHYILTFLLCVTLLATMGFDYVTRKNTYNPETTSNSKAAAESDHPLIMTSAPIDPQDQANTPSAIAADAVNISSPTSPNVESPIVEPAAPEVQQAKYEVTAYYLNVRAEANNTSQILGVVTKGSTLEVVGPTDQGWLELKSGGYVHGGYAALIGAEDVKPSPQLQTVQSAERTLVVQAAPPEKNSQPAEPSKPTSKVKSASGLTEEHIAKIIENTALEGQGLEKPILEIEEMYGINSYFTIAVMKLESGHGKSQLARTKNNLFGLNAVDSDAYNKAISFKTKGDSVKKFGEIISAFYFDKGLTSVEKVAGKYCQANSKWPSLVKSIMNSDYDKIA